MQVVESDLTASEVKPGVELLDCLAVGRGVGEVDLTFALRIGEAAGSLHGNIGLAGERIVVSGKSLHDRQVGVLDVGSESECTVAGEMTVQKAGGSVELDRSVVTPKNGTAKGNDLEGKLDRSGKRVPMCLKLARFPFDGPGYVEVVDFQTASKLRDGKRTAHAAIESRSAVQRDGKQLGTANDFDEGKPVSDT